MSFFQLLIMPAMPVKVHFLFTFVQEIKSLLHYTALNGSFYNFI